MKPLLFAFVFLSACQTKNTKKENLQSTEEMKSKTDTTLIASLEVDSVVTLTDSISVLFLVNNPTEDTLRFTQYHTPFEGFMSNFLTITDEKGNEVSYIGAMTRRVMPPPEDTYHSLAPGQTDSVRFILNKGYRFDKAGLYTIQYNGGSVNGLSSDTIVKLNIQ